MTIKPNSIEQEIEICPFHTVVNMQTRIRTKEWNTENSKERMDSQIPAGRKT